jgi:type I restriction enzyme S subunit
MRKMPLGDVLSDIENGLSVKQSKDAGGTPITRIETISTGEVNPAKVGYAGISGGSHPRRLLRRGDILFSHINSFEHVGKCAIYQGSPPELIHGMNLLRLRPGTELVLPKYLLFAIRSPEFRSSIRPYINRAVYQASISIANLIRVEVPVPGIDEQLHIVRVLEEANRLVVKRERAIALMDELVQSIFLEMFGDPASNPKGWDRCTIGDLIESANYGTSQKAGPSGNVPVLRMGNITVRGEIDLSDLKFLQGEDVAEKYIVRKGDILFNRTNSADLVGKTAVFRDDSTMAYAGYLVRMRTNDANDPDYISAFLNSGYGKRVLRGIARSIVGMANINARELKSIPIPAVPLDLQRDFADKLQLIERQKRVQKSSLMKLAEIFISLQSKAFRGEL